MRRIRALALLGLGLSLMGFYAAWLLAQAYSAQASTIARWRPSSPAAHGAALQAVRLAPWNAGYRADLAWMIQVRHPRTARTQMRRALSWSPANAYAWSDYSRLLVRQRKFGTETDAAMLRASQLAPTSDSIRSGNAEMALHFWTWASPQTRRLWLRALRHELARRPHELLQKIRDAKRVRVFCLGPGAELPLDRWCAQTPWE